MQTIKLTLAEQEALRREEPYYKGSSRKSKRSETAQRVTTSRLRRIREIFWDHDSLYSKDKKEKVDSDNNEDLILSSCKRPLDDSSKIDDGDGDGDGVIAQPDSAGIYTPELDNSDSASCASSSHGIESEHNFGGRMRLKKIHDSPHIFTIDNFLTDKEMNKLEEKIKLAEKHSLFESSFLDDGGVGSGSKAKTKRKRKSNVIKSPVRTCIEMGIQNVIVQDDTANADNNIKESGGEIDNYAQGNKTINNNTKEKADFSSDSGLEPKKQRTSTFLHFSKLSNSTIAAIENRAADLLSLPNHSVEPLQLVRYGRGQYFDDHHDIGVLFEDGSVELPKKCAMSPPRRLVTILVYLNDLPGGCGGGTTFPLLTKRTGRSSDDAESLCIRPKKAMAVMWCNVTKDGNPDPRLVHRGEMIKMNYDCVKYAMNIWACEE